ncbi:MAG: TetR/AcrR family transcriptional regulator [Jatrophihabitantaceae bacterium]
MGHRSATLTTPPARPHVPVKHIRRSQAARVEAMRTRLLDATLECLAERGYSNTSTNDIVRRAHVSRGALAHHFRTRNDLFSAAAQRLITARAAEFRERFTAIAPARRTPAEALTVLWSFYDDAAFVAMMELMIASRHEPELRAVLAPMSDQIADITAAVVADFLPELAGLPLLDGALRSIHALFAGLALGALASSDGQGRGADVRAFVQVLVSLAPQFTAQLTAIPDSSEAP